MSHPATSSASIRRTVPAPTVVFTGYDRSHGDAYDPASIPAAERANSLGRHYRFSVKDGVVHLFAAKNTRLSGGRIATVAGRVIPAGQKLALRAAILEHATDAAPVYAKRDALQAEPRDTGADADSHVAAYRAEVVRECGKVGVTIDTYGTEPAGKALYAGRRLTWSLGLSGSLGVYADGVPLADVPADLVDAITVMVERMGYSPDYRRGLVKPFPRATACAGPEDDKVSEPAPEEPGDTSPTGRALVVGGPDTTRLLAFHTTPVAFPGLMGSAGDMVGHAVDVDFSALERRVLTMSEVPWPKFDSPDRGHGFVTVKPVRVTFPSLSFRDAYPNGAPDYRASFELELDDGTRGKIEALAERIRLGRWTVYKAFRDRGMTATYAFGKVKAWEASSGTATFSPAPEPIAYLDASGDGTRWVSGVRTGLRFARFVTTGEGGVPFKGRDRHVRSWATSEEAGDGSPRYAGVAFRLPCRRTEGRENRRLRDLRGGHLGTFVAGYVALDHETESWSDNAACLDFGRTFSNLSEAVVAANELAGRAADRVREDHKGMEARWAWEDLEVDIGMVRAEARELVGQAQAVRAYVERRTPGLWARLMDDVRTLVDRVRELRARRAALAAEFAGSRGWGMAA